MHNKIWQEIYYFATEDTFSTLLGKYKKPNTEHQMKRDCLETEVYVMTDCKNDVLIDQKYWHC